MMPVFEYKCGACSLKFEKILKDAPPNLPCPSCNAEASKAISGFGFSFGEGKVRGNTGVDSLDSSLDHAVGRDAKRRWESVKDRQSEKFALRREANGALVHKTGEGYAAMSGEQTAKVRDLRKLKDTL